MIRSLILLLALSVPAWAGDPAQYNLVQSPPSLAPSHFRVVDGFTWRCAATDASPEPEDRYYQCTGQDGSSYFGKLAPTDDLLRGVRVAQQYNPAQSQPRSQATTQEQLDRIEAILRAICERQAIGQPTAREAATTCPEEPKP